MKKLCFLCLATTALLTGCTNEETSTSEIISLDYELVSNKHISWTSIFEVTEDRYYVYIYSVTCGHCNQIKEDVISYSLKHNYFYFVTYDISIPLVNNRSLVIGKDSVDGLGIMGTPSLFEIEQGIITNYYLGSKEIIDTLSKPQ